MAPIDESQWKHIRATLPPGVDEVWFRGELERIKTERVSPKKQEQSYLDRVRHCADFIRDLPSMEHIKDKGALLEQIKRQQQEDMDRAKHYGRIAAQKGPARFLKQCEILQLWERVGGNLKITTKRKSRNDPHHPQPTGAVILYFQAAALAIWGKAPSARQIKDIRTQYRRKFRSAIIGSFTSVTVKATAVKRATTHIASSTGVRARRYVAERRRPKPSGSG